MSFSISANVLNQRREVNHCDTNPPSGSIYTFVLIYGSISIDCILAYLISRARDTKPSRTALLFPSMCVALVYGDYCVTRLLHQCNE